MTQKKLKWYYDNEKKFSQAGRSNIFNLLETADDDQFNKIISLKIKDPTVAIILAFAFGIFSADRFYLKEIGVGIIKLFTCGCVFVLYFIDIFTAKTRTYRYNDKKVLEILSSYSASQVYNQNMQDMQNGINKAIKTAQGVKKVADIIDDPNDYVVIGR